MEKIAVLMDKFTVNTINKHCDKHGDYVSNSFKIGSHVGSGACFECEKERREEIARAAYVDHRVKYANIPLRFKEKDLKNFLSHTPETEKALNAMWRYIENYKENLERGVSWIICGPVGVGKTHLAIGLLKEIIKHGITAIYCTFSDFAREIKESYNFNKSEEILQKYVSTNFLILDELGIKGNSEHDDNILFDLINKRYEQFKPTVIISNLNEETLKKVVGERIIDRLKENNGKLLNLTGKSMRG